MTSPTAPPPNQAAATGSAIGARRFIPSSTLRFIDWVKSGKFRPFGRRGGIILIIAVALYIVVNPIADYNLLDYPRNSAEYRHNDLVELMRNISHIAVLVFAASVILAMYVQSRDEFDAELQKQELSELKKRERALRASPTATYDELYEQNQERIDFYHDIATRQSKQSFRNGQFAMYIGFGLVVLLAIFAALAPSGTAAIAASVIGVATAGLSGYVGATFMKSQAAASQQLREFFLEPVENARSLNAERFLVKLAADKREDALRDIIRGIIGAQPKEPKEKKEEPSVSPSGGPPPTP
jgi:hypothetical protein